MRMAGAQLASLSSAYAAWWDGGWGPTSGGRACQALGTRMEKTREGVTCVVPARGLPLEALPRLTPGMAMFSPPFPLCRHRLFAALPAPLPLVPQAAMSPGRCSWRNGSTG
jgi:hypothetical protein